MLSFHLLIQNRNINFTHSTTLGGTYLTPTALLVPTVALYFCVFELFIFGISSKLMASTKQA